MQSENVSTQAAICPHCKKEGEGNVCSQCGEVLHPQRITADKILKSIPDVFFDLEYGLLYTIRTFLTRPGNEIKEYFAGDRQKHYKPMKFILFIGGLVTFLKVMFDVNDGTPQTVLEDFEADWSTAILIFQFPVIALLTYLIFKRRKYTYGEHLVASAYLIGEVLLYHLLVFPITLLVNGTMWVTVIENLYLFVWVPAYFTYVYYDWFYERKTAAGFFKSLAITFGIFFTTLMITAILEVTFISMFILKK